METMVIRKEAWNLLAKLWIFVGVIIMVTIYFGQTEVVTKLIFTLKGQNENL